MATSAVAGCVMPGATATAAVTGADVGGGGVVAAAVGVGVGATGPGGEVQPNLWGGVVQPCDEGAESVLADDACSILHLPVGGLAQRFFGSVPDPG